MKAKDKLKAYWSKKENDVMLHHPMGIQTKCDAHFLSEIFNETFTESLKSRGYDIETFKFEISPKKGNKRFASERNNQLVSADKDG